MLMDLGAERDASPLDNMPTLPAIPKENTGLAWLLGAALIGSAMGLWSWRRRRLVAAEAKDRQDVIACRDAITRKWLDYHRTFIWAPEVGLADQIAPFLIPLASYLGSTHPRLAALPTESVLELIGAGIMDAGTHPAAAVRQAIEEAKINCRGASRG